MTDSASLPPASAPMAEQVAAAEPQADGDPSEGLSEEAQEFLGWDAAHYEAVKAELVAAGRVVPGRGRGGSVAIAGSAAAAPTQGRRQTGPANSRTSTAVPPAGLQPKGKQNLSAFIWGVADLLRGDYKQSDYGKVILPFTVLRRLDCVLEPTKAAVLVEKAQRVAQDLDPEPFLLRVSAQNFCNTSPLTMKKLMGDQENIAENLRSYIQGFTPEVRDIFEKFEFHLQVDRLEKADLLYMVAERFAQIDLHPETVSNAEMGLVFEELIRKFAELSNETAGEHFTPREVIKLMVNLIFIEDGEALTRPGVVRSLYDPTGGTGGTLSVGEEHLLELNPLARLVMYGQELNPESYAICKADMLIKGQDPGCIDVPAVGSSRSASQATGSISSMGMAQTSSCYRFRGAVWKKPLSSGVWLNRVCPARVPAIATRVAGACGWPLPRVCRCSTATRKTLSSQRPCRCRQPPWW